MPHTQAAPPGYDVFFSYDREDTAWAQKLADALRGRGLRVWIDSGDPGRRGVGGGDRGRGCARLAADSANIPTDTQAVVAPPDGQAVVQPAPDSQRTPPRPPAGPPAQIVTPGDHAHAAAVGNRLAAAGFQVLGTEYVARAPRLRNTELRYYKRADEPDAQRLLQALRAAGEESAVPLYLGLESNTRVRPRHYEVWFAAGAGQGARQPVRRP